MVCDSLRRDLIRQDVAPTLTHLQQTACDFAKARSVFPSTTRVSAASIATGHLPARHGLLGNTMAIDEGNGLMCLSVGKPDFRDRLRRATGRTLHVPTMAERLHNVGGFVAMSNVSPGAAYFLDPDGFGFVYHRAGSFSPGLRPVAAEDHLAIKVGAVGDAIMTDRFCSEVLLGRRASLGILWLSEPDHTGHIAPLGSPAHLDAIASADRHVAQVLNTVARLERAGEDVLTIVCSDHGMETVRNTIPLTTNLVAAGLKASDGSSEIVVAPNGTSALIYVAPHARNRIAGLHAYLKVQPWVQQVFSGADLARIGLPGGTVGLALTLATENRSNPFGVTGYGDIVTDPDDNKDYTGHGQHGGLGPNEQCPFLIVSGGGFRTSRKTSVSASLVDIAPTVLRHLGLGYDGMEGQPLPFNPPPLLDHRADGALD